ncbi:MAG TPA: DNA polymerase III subunit delta' [Methylococcaceae bacterium]|nr:DNA polymerase III subunit delta' [Methylococcaceae bacterium]
MQPPYPWLAPAWEALGDYLRAARLPQALLIHGPEGLGKRSLAEAFAQRLLCQGNGDELCGQCVGCRLWAAGTHPHYHAVHPEEPGKAIHVDAIRTLSARFALKSQYAGWRLAVIDPADAMNASAANALLKTLEEPPERSLLILLSSAPGRLPATILSRCQRLPVHPPSKAQALAWLALRQDRYVPADLWSAASGSPLRALEMSEKDYPAWREKLYGLWNGGDSAGAVDPALAAESFSAVPLEYLLEWLMQWAMELIRRMYVPDQESFYNVPRMDVLLQAGRLDSVEIHAFLDRLVSARRLLIANPQLNRPLILEETLVGWFRFFS